MYVSFFRGVGGGEKIVEILECMSVSSGGRGGGEKIVEILECMSVSSGCSDIYSSGLSIS